MYSIQIRYRSYSIPYIRRASFFFFTLSHLGLELRKRIGILIFHGGWGKIIIRNHWQEHVLLLLLLLPFIVLHHIFLHKLCLQICKFCFELILIHSIPHFLP